MRFFMSSSVLVLLCRQACHAFVMAPLAKSGGFITRNRGMATMFVTSSEEVESMRAGEIKKELESYGISTKSFLEKSELIDALTKARAEGKKPRKPASSSSSTSSSTSSTGPSSKDTSSTSSKPREERLKEELKKCRAMKASELKKELQERGVSTKSFFEKSEFAQALAEARVDGVEKKNTADDGEGYAEYKNVEVLTDDASGPREKQSGQQQQKQQGSSPFGGGNPFGGAAGGNPFGGAAGGNPFGGAAGANPFGGAASGMGNIADMLKNMGMGGATGGSPFGGGGGGMGDAMGKAQELMQNPKVRALMAKAQSNPKVMAAMTECMSNPAAFAKYQNDPEVADIINELKQYM